MEMHVWLAVIFAFLSFLSYHNDYLTQVAVASIGMKEGGKVTQKLDRLCRVGRILMFASASLAIVFIILAIVH